MLRGLSGRCRERHPLPGWVGRREGSEGNQWQPHGQRDRIQTGAAAFRADLPAAFLPAPPAFFNCVGPGTAVHVFGQIKEFAKSAAFRAPALWRVVAEILRVERLERPAALRTRTLG